MITDRKLYKVKYNKIYMIQPKLTQEQEREVALAYLCGVRSKNFQELFGVSHSTVSNNIVGKRSKEWDDKLVEFYNKDIDVIINKTFSNNEIKTIDNNLRMSFIEF